MPDKVMPDDSVGMAPGLPDVPPSEFPEMDDDDSAKSGMLAYLMRVGLGNLLGRKKPELGAGLPVLPPGFNLSMPQEPTPDVPIFEPGLISNETEEGNSSCHLLWRCNTRISDKIKYMHIILYNKKFVFEKTTTRNGARKIQPDIVHTKYKHGGCIQSGGFRCAFIIEFSVPYRPCVYHIGLVCTI